MYKILVTGGTTFVSKYAADFFQNRGYEVYVLNRNTKPQESGCWKETGVIREIF